MERKLASIQRVSQLRPILGADKIEVATVLGWECIVKKGEFQVGDLGVYIEIDSVCPIENPNFEFLTKAKGRIKTIKMRGQISQGLLLPMSILETPASEDTDVTELLGIVKYDPPEVGEGIHAGRTKGIFPPFLTKTDEDRIQVKFDYLSSSNVTFDYTEKLDGTSFTCYYRADTDTFGVCSRNLEVSRPEDVKESIYWEMAAKYGLEAKLRNLGKNLCIQGEIVGPGIQGNKYRLNEHRFYLYTVYTILESKQKYTNAQVREFAQAIDVPAVPHLGTFQLKDIASAIELSKGFSTLNPEILREGIVCRNGSTSFKVIQPEFLLQYGG